MTHFALDYCLLLLFITDKIHRGPHLFHFEKFWLTYPKLAGVVHQAWNGFDNHKPINKISLLLKEINCALKSWKYSIDNLNSQAWGLYDLIYDLQMKESQWESLPSNLHSLLLSYL